MATNASTWFYNEPEHTPYLIEERVNHTFWSNRIMAIHLRCTSAEPPFRMSGQWHNKPVALEWVPNDHLVMTTSAEDDMHRLIIGIKEILGFSPTISYEDRSGQLIVEWHVKDAAARIQEVQGDPNFRQIKRYTK
jgi:hypothetical protein